MAETERQPQRKRATISVAIEDGEIVLKGKWYDADGKKHDLGFAKLPTWGQAETMLCAMAKRLSSLNSTTKEQRP